MNVELYIGNEKLDFNEPINVVMSVGDIRDISLGNLNNSYTLNVPLTKTNSTILKHCEIPGSTDEISSTGRLFVNGLQIIYGRVKILGSEDDYLKMIITADDWIDDLLNTDLRDIDFSAEDHDLTKANIVASWSASDAFYRYPMINFGQLVTPATGSQPHDWGVNDFIPMFRIIDILEYIFSPWIIVSDWFSNAYAKKLYILCPEIIADNDFILNRALEVHPAADSSNQTSVSIDLSATEDIQLAKDPVVLNNEIKDEGTDFNNGTYKYTVPETGTYRFIFTWTSEGVGSGPFFTINTSDYDVNIKINNVSIAQKTDNDAGGGTCVNVTGETLDTGYIHLEENDEVKVTIEINANVTNDTGPDPDTFYVRLKTTTKIETSWDQWNRYPAKNKNITAADYLPDIKCIDFIKAVKQLANLKFFADRTNHKIYIEPAQTFFVTDKEVDLTNYQDYENIISEPITGNYNKVIRMGLLEDLEDKAYTEWKDYTGGNVPDKLINLSSVYAEPGEYPISNNLFAYSGTGFFQEILAYGFVLIKIFGDQEYIDYDQAYPAYRATGWKPRLVTWEGLTAGISFDIEATNYTQYPKVLPVEMNDLYTNYWITSIHQIDKNIIVTIRIKLPAQVINQLLTVISDSSAEGFRPRYKLLVRNQYVYGYLNKIITDGDISECEFIIKN